MKWHTVVEEQGMMVHPQVLIIGMQVLVEVVVAKV
jgi:hypothetical protein